MKTENRHGTAALSRVWEAAARNGTARMSHAEINREITSSRRAGRGSQSKKKTRAEVLAAIKASKMRPMLTWDELREMTREP